MARPKRHGLRWVVLALFMALVVPGAGLGAWLVHAQYTGNFHVVDAGQVYRSNTMSPAQLRSVIETDHIKSILNLRGGSPSDGWYADETAVATSLGVAIIDMPLSEDAIPAPRSMTALIFALEHAPRPLLIHCKAGADRTGLAAALYDYLVARKPAEIAARQLSLFYGHFPYYPSRTGAMDEAFWQVAHDQRKSQTARPGPPDQRSDGGH